MKAYNIRTCRDVTPYALSNITQVLEGNFFVSEILESALKNCEEQRCKPGIPRSKRVLGKRTRKEKQVFQYLTGSEKSNNVGLQARHSGISAGNEATLD